MNITRGTGKTSNFCLSLLFYGRVCCLLKCYPAYNRYNQQVIAESFNTPDSNQIEYPSAHTFSEGSCMFTCRFPCAQFGTEFICIRGGYDAVSVEFFFSIVTHEMLMLVNSGLVVTTIIGCWTFSLKIINYWPFCGQNITCGWQTVVEWCHFCSAWWQVPSLSFDTSEWN